MSKRKKVRSQAAPKTQKRFIPILIIGLALGATLAAWAALRQPAEILAGDGILAIPVNEHEFGSVPVSRGAVSTELTLANVGEDDLVISFLDSSCGCTTARVINGDEKGPVFGMSSQGRSPTDWRTTIEPGQKALLKIYYDPNVHPKFRGPATRVVTIRTNGKTTPEKQVRIKVYQTD
jgi:hypothetical protein